MEALVTAVRRLLWLVLIAAVGGGIYAWWRDRRRDDDHAPPEWPPLAPRVDADAASGPAEADPSLGAERRSPSRAATGRSDVASRTGATPGAGSSVVNSLVDAPEARSTDGASGAWVEPLSDGSCPASHPVKANDNSGIFHVPTGRFYARTNPERCYATPEAALADGYRQAKN